MAWRPLVEDVKGNGRGLLQPCCLLPEPSQLPSLIVWVVLLIREQSLLYSVPWLHKAEGVFAGVTASFLSLKRRCSYIRNT